LIITKKKNVAGLPVPRHRKVKSKEKSGSRAGKGVGDLESGLGRNSGDLGSVLKRNQRGGILKYLKVPKGIGHKCGSLL
jgi:hypothetical protein